MLHGTRMDRRAADVWIRAHVKPVGAFETVHRRPWATVLRVPHADGLAWFKACAPVGAAPQRYPARGAGAFDSDFTVALRRAVAQTLA